MIDALWAISPGVTSALQAKGAKLFIATRDANALYPMGLMERVDESRGLFYGHIQTTVRLHLWAINLGVLRDLEEAVSYLDDFSIPAGYGKSAFLSVHLQGKQSVTEPDAIHTVLDYLVDCADKRKIS